MAGARPGHDENNESFSNDQKALKVIFV